MISIEEATQGFEKNRKWFHCRLKNLNFRSLSTEDILQEIYIDNVEEVARHSTCEAQAQKIFSRFLYPWAVTVCRRHFGRTISWRLQNVPGDVNDFDTPGPFREFDRIDEADELEYTLQRLRHTTARVLKLRLAGFTHRQIHGFGIPWTKIQYLKEQIQEQLLPKENSNERKKNENG